MSEVGTADAEPAPAVAAEGAGEPQAPDTKGKGQKTEVPGSEPAKPATKRGPKRPIEEPPPPPSDDDEEEDKNEPRGGRAAARPEPASKRARAPAPEPAAAPALLVPAPAPAPAPVQVTKAAPSAPSAPGGRKVDAWGRAEKEEDTRSSAPREAWEYLKKDSFGAGNFFDFSKF
mmetsp:Transcript_91829/g.286257  ORF Transcript_91829/g.286257 Transcript_91829/m.286257 type:complete len:174 (-) Transcript_91829:33-554(-)